MPCMSEHPWLKFFPYRCVVVSPPGRFAPIRFAPKLFDIKVVSPKSKDIYPYSLVLPPKSVRKVLQIAAYLHRQPNGAGIPSKIWTNIQKFFVFFTLHNVVSWIKKLLVYCKIIVDFSLLLF